MWLYTLKRIITLFPTLFLITVIAFIIIDAIPDDQALRLLQLKGIEENNPNFDQEYKSAQKTLLLNLPTFYISLRAGYKDPFRSLKHPMKRKLALTLNNQKYKSAYCIMLVDSLWEYYSANQINKQAFFVKNMEELKKELSQHDQANAILQKSNEYKVQWHFPKIHWNGLKNRYHQWMTKFIAGNFGQSMADGQPVEKKISSAIQWTLTMIVLSLLLTLLTAIPLGIYLSLHYNSLLDRLVSNTLFIFYAIPKFWLATVMIIFFTTAEYGWITNIFPSVGLWTTSKTDPFIINMIYSWKQLILPIFVLSISDIAYLSSIVKNNLLDERKKPYAITAKSKGLTNRQIGRHHLISNTLTPIITLLATGIPAALGGSLIIETIFNIPGMGRLLYHAISSSDWNVALAVLVLVSIITIIFLLLGDLIIAKINPKIKLK